MKEVKSNFTDTQRKALLDFVRVYGDAYDRARDAYRATRVSLTDSMIREEAGRKGWLPVITKLADLKEDVTRTEAELAKYGVDLDEEGRAEFGAAALRHSACISHPRSAKRLAMNLMCASRSLMRRQNC